MIRKFFYNNIFQNLQIFLNIILSLYGLKIILQHISVEEYGLYTLSVGFIALLSFFYSALSQSFTRYYSYYSHSMRAKIFMSALIIGSIIGLLSTVIITTVGGIYFKQYANIDQELMDLSNVLFKIIMITTFIRFLRIPFDSIMQSALMFDRLAIVETLDILLRFIFILNLGSTEIEKLYYLAGSVTISTIISSLVIVIISFREFKDLRISKTNFSLPLIKEMTSFFSWNMFGAAAGLIRDQGISILFNTFGGLTINGYYGIAMQINSVLRKLSSSLINTIRPKLYEYQGKGKQRMMFYLISILTRLGFFFSLLIFIPMIFNFDFILDIWINQSAREIYLFVYLITSLTLLNLITAGVQTGLQAVGDIKQYQITVGSMIISIPFVGFILLFFEFTIYSVLVFSIIIEVMALISRFRIFSRICTDYSLIQFYHEILKPIVQVTLITILNGYLLSILFKSESLYQVITYTLIHVGSFIFLVYKKGLIYNEQVNLLTFIKNI